MGLTSIYCAAYHVSPERRKAGGGYLPCLRAHILSQHPWQIVRLDFDTIAQSLQTLSKHLIRPHCSSSSAAKSSLQYMQTSSSSDPSVSYNIQVTNSQCYGSYWSGSLSISAPVFVAV
jgi:hypothetical protein